MEEMAVYSNNPVITAYRKIEDNIEDLYHNAPRDMIVLGAADEEFSTEPIGFPFDGRQFNLVVFGKKGTGKTNLCALIVNQTYNRFQLPLFIGDPKWEYFSHIMPTKNEFLKERLRRYGLQPKNLPVFIVTPEFLVDEEDKNVAGYVYKLDLSDFKRIKKLGERFDTLVRFFGLSGGSADSSQRALLRWINKLPDSFSEFVLKLSHESRIIVAGSDKKRPAGSKLLDSLQSFRLSGAIGKGNRFYAPAVMMKKNNELGNPVLLQLSVDGAEDPITSSYLKMCLYDIIQDRVRAKKLKKGFLMRPPVVLLDEADLYCPSIGFPPAKKTIEKLPTKYRVWDISTIFATQKPTYVSPRLITDCDYLVTSRLQSIAERQVLKAKGLGDDDIEMIFGDLVVNKSVPWGNELAIIYPDMSFESFFALPSPSEMFHEEKVRFEGFY